MIFGAVFTCRGGVNACLLERVCLYPASAVLLHFAHFLCFSLFLLICMLNVNFLRCFQNLPIAQKAVYKEFLIELKDWFFPPSKIRMADVRKINMTSLILTSKEVVHNKEYRIKPQGINCLLCAKQFSGVTFVEEAVFTECQEIQSQ